MQENYGLGWLRDLPDIRDYLAPSPVGRLARMQEVSNAGAVAERVGERRIKTTTYIPLIPTFSLKGEGAGTCVDSYAPRERARVRAFQMSLYQLRLLYKKP
ncbi:MAG: hypothetical protein Q7U66_13755 [Methylobacter sp.]|nr:hypothetical protein [Methylobacter sp.]